MLCASLLGSLPRVPRSLIIPSVHRNACQARSFGMREVPTTCRASLTQSEYAAVPPNDPKSFMPSDLVQRKASVAVSPIKFDQPTTSPWLFNQFVDPRVPPKVPRSVIFPFSQRNGSCVGTPVVTFGVEFVYDCPAIWPRSFKLDARASGPPSVPKSLTVPLCQRKALVCVGKPSMEKESATSLSEKPTTSPRLLTAVERPSVPPGTVPKSIIFPSFVQRTALPTGIPVESRRPFSDHPAIRPFALIELVWPFVPAGSRSNSERVPSCQDTGRST